MMWDIKHLQSNGVEIEHRILFDVKSRQFYGGENLLHTFSEYPSYYRFITSLLTIHQGRLIEPNIRWAPAKTDK